jgi:enoyl-CoA hydratase/carnithine racemase
MSIKTCTVPFGTTGMSALVIAWSSPDKLNAVSPGMLSAAADELESAESDDSIVAVVFCGDPASKLTSSGADLSANEEGLGDTGPMHAGTPVERFMKLVVRSRCLIAFAVYSGAVGMNLTLLPHCDLVLAAEDAWFSTPFGTLGINPEWGASRTLPRQLGRLRAQRIMLWGDRLSVADALRFGLVTGIVPLAKGAGPSNRLAAAEALPSGVELSPSLKPLLTPVLAAVLHDLSRLVATVPRPVESVKIFRAMLRAGEAEPDATASPAGTDDSDTALGLASRGKRMSMEELIAWELRILEARVAEGVPVEAMMQRAATRQSKL